MGEAKEVLIMGSIRAANEIEYASYEVIGTAPMKRSHNHAVDQRAMTSHVRPGIKHPSIDFKGTALPRIGYF